MPSNTGMLLAVFSASLLSTVSAFMAYGVELKGFLSSVLVVLPSGSSTSKAVLADAEGLTSTSKNKCVPDVKFGKLVRDPSSTVKIPSTLGVTVYVSCQFAYPTESTSIFPAPSMSAASQSLSVHNEKRTLCAVMIGAEAASVSFAVYVTLYGTVLVPGGAAAKLTPIPARRIVNVSDKLVRFLFTIFMFILKLILPWIMICSKQSKNTACFWVS